MNEIKERYPEVSIFLNYAFIFLIFSIVFFSFSEEFVLYIGSISFLYVVIFFVRNKFFLFVFSQQIALVYQYLVIFFLKKSRLYLLKQLLFFFKFLLFFFFILIFYFFDLLKFNSDSCYLFRKKIWIIT
jgi:hypothetical protein